MNKDMEIAVKTIFRPKGLYGVEIFKTSVRLYEHSRLGKAANHINETFWSQVAIKQCLTQNGHISRIALN